MFIIKNLLLHIFIFSLNSGVFSDNMKIATFSPLLRNGEKNKLKNYISISAVPILLYLKNSICILYLKKILSQKCIHNVLMKIAHFSKKNWFQS